MVTRKGRYGLWALSLYLTKNVNVGSRRQLFRGALSGIAGGGCLTANQSRNWLLSKTIFVFYFLRRVSFYYKTKDEVLLSRQVAHHCLC